MKNIIVFALLLLCGLSLVQGVCYNSLNLTSEDGVLKVNGNRFLLKGLSWFGFDTSNNVFHGLWAVDYHDLLDFIKNNGFNAIRIPFWLGLMLNDATPNSINFYQMNTDLQGLTSLQVLDKIIAAAADRGLLIMLDLHSFLPGTFAQDGLWYDSTHPESMVISMWDKVIARYSKTWNVVALDLKNEPHDSTWNTGNNATDWNAAAQRIGTHILQNGGSNFLIFVEGTASSPSCAQNCFWGEDLLGVTNAPIILPDQKKLVYSPHVYGPSVSAQPYFTDPSFPTNMPDIWQAHFGFVPQKSGQAIVVGEWGGFLQGNDQVWMEAFVGWLNSKGTTDTFFWCLNPDSGDTGGLLQNDWKTPETGKLQLLQKLVPKPSSISTSGSQICIN